MLKHHYNAFLFAYGASKDRELGLVGERDGKHIYSARAFVGWYNGLPEYAQLDPDLTVGDTAVIIGQGNVALDVARTLLTDVDVLRKTDMTDHALSILSKSRIKHVHLVGRRGPVQGAYTIKEVRELMQLPNTYFEPIPSDLFPNDLKMLPRPQKRLMELLQKGSSIAREDSTKSWSLDFLLAPKSIHWMSQDSTILDTTAAGGPLDFVRFDRTSLADPASPTSPLLPIDNTTESHRDIPASILFRSIGYKAEALPGFTDLGVPFNDEKGMIPNDGVGRVISEDQKTVVPGVYCAGWVKRGPTGVIASTMADAFSTAEAIAADWDGGKGAQRFLQGSGDGWEGVKRSLHLQGKRVSNISWDDWKKIDAVERDRGTKMGKEREKLRSVREMLEVLGR